MKSFVLFLKVFKIVRREFSLPAPLKIMDNQGVNDVVFKKLISRG